MLASSLALSLALLQKEQVSVVYTGVPSSSNTAVRLVTHDAKTTLSKTTATTDELSYLKNMSDKAVSVTVSIPIEGENVGWGMPDQVQCSVSVDNEPIAINKQAAKETPTTDEHKKASGIVDDTYSSAYTFQLNFVGRAAHSLKIRFESPVGKAGLDHAQRVYGYSLTGAGTWNGSVGQLNVALKYTTRVVFQIAETIPDGKWETGATGAFFKQLDFAPQGSSRAMFIYYPGGFDKLGGS